MTRYVECFKFLLSIGNDNEFNVVNSELKDVPEDAEGELIDLFLRIFDRIAELKNNLLAENYVPSITAYMEIFKDFIFVGYLLGITFEEVFDFYDKVYQDMVRS